MDIELRLFASLRKRVKDTGANEISLPEGSTVQDLCDRLKIKKDEVRIIMVNGIHCDRDFILQNGDRVGLFPPVGGG